MFLAALLVLGTIATILPSAQAQPYYEERYAPEYPPYNDNNDYKSEDSNVILNKIKCNNINDNLNNVNVNSGLPNGFDDIVQAQAADNEGQATTANGLYGERNGYKQNDNDFKFVCINNNDNENNVVVVNETTPIPPPPPPPDTITCEECFTENENLTPEQLDAINTFLGDLDPLTVSFFEEQIDVNDLTALCTYLTLSSTEEDLRNSVFNLIANVNAFILDPNDIIEEFVEEEIVQCILEALDIDTDTTGITGGLAASNINTDTSSSNINTAGGLVATSFSSPPTITQGTEEDLSALEKTTKLKQQWLSLLP